MELKEVCGLLDYIQEKEDDKKLVLLEYLTEIRDKLEYITNIVETFDEYLYEQNEKQIKPSTESIKNGNYEEIQMQLPF